MSSLYIILMAVAVILALVSLGVGIYFIIRYARSRKTPFLITGLVLTFVLPGLFLCVVLGIFIPATTIVYGPPPPTNIVYGPPPTFPTSTP